MVDAIILGSLLQLIILFTVIFDPPASLAVFFASTQALERKERHKIAWYAVLVAASLSFLVLVLGGKLLELFSTTLDEFRVAGGIILGILGVRMAMGYPLMHLDKLKEDSGMAMAAIIGTPLLTGPAAITTIIVSVKDYGMLLTGVAVAIVLALTALMFLHSGWINRFMGKTAIQIASTVLGMITISWGVKFIAVGLRGMFF